MDDEIMQISFDEFEAIFRSKIKPGEPIKRDDIKKAWNAWQTQDCFLCKSEDVNFRALFEAPPDKRKEFALPPGEYGLFMYSLCSKCFDNKDIEQISEVILKYAVASPVH